MLAVGERLDRYRVEAEIGRGAMATVYRVRHAELDAAFALKVMAVDRADARERFRREARLQATLRHPNVVGVHDFLEVGGRPALVMELVEGPSLGAFLAGRRLAVEDAEALFCRVLDGVEAAHSARIVHRDLKPSNILLARTHGALVPKVGDFGLAKLLADDPSAMALTASGTTMGTPGYLAPEQIRNAKHVDHRADLFSLGCVLYLMVTGRTAFSGDIREVFNAATSGAYAPPGPEVPERIAAAIAGALAVDRERRFQSCAEFRASLAASSIPPAAPAPQADALPPPGTAREPRADTFTLQPEQAEHRASGRKWWLAAALALGGGIAFWAGLR